MAQKSDKHGQDGHVKAAKARIGKDADMDAVCASDPQKDAVTESSEESFPASDPPSFMGGGSIAGSPLTRPVETIPAPDKQRHKQEHKQEHKKADKTH